MAEIAVLRTHIINYAKTRETYVAVSYTHLDVYKRQTYGYPLVKAMQHRKSRRHPKG